MRSWCTIVETPKTFTNGLELKATNSLCVWVCYYASKTNFKKEYELEAPPTTFYILEKMNGWIIVDVRPQF